MMGLLNDYMRAQTDEDADRAACELVSVWGLHMIGREALNSRLSAFERAALARLYLERETPGAAHEAALVSHCDPIVRAGAVRGLCAAGRAEDVARVFDSDADADVRGVAAEALEVLRWP
jgi:hypothetical protein